MTVYVCGCGVLLYCTVRGGVSSMTVYVFGEYKQVFFYLVVFCFTQMKKGSLKDEEAIASDVVAQSHVENAALKLFEFADTQDRQSNFSKYVLKQDKGGGVEGGAVCMLGKVE